MRAISPDKSGKPLLFISGNLLRAVAAHFSVPLREPSLRTFQCRSANHRCALFSAAPRTIAAQLLGGAYRDRTDDLMLAKQPLSQLS